MPARHGAPRPAKPPMTDERRNALHALLHALGLPPCDDVLPLLELALTHRSWRMEQGEPEDNERLEFLGDAVIGHATTRYLYRVQPDEPEGSMSKQRAAIVSRRALGAVGREAGIGPLLYLGAGEDQTGGRMRSSNLGSALEAVCGACSLVYPWEQLASAIEMCIVAPALEIIESDSHTDYKSLLQEWTQSQRQCVPEYQVAGSNGPDHLRQFTVHVLIGGELFGIGKGQRKKAAENDAARHALSRINGSKGPSR